MLTFDIDVLEQKFEAGELEYTAELAVLFQYYADHRMLESKGVRYVNIAKYLAEQKLIKLNNRTGNHWMWWVMLVLIIMALIPVAFLSLVHSLGI